MKKYEMTSNVKEFLGHKLFQIKALKDFGDVKAGIWEVILKRKKICRIMAMLGFTTM